MAEGKNPQDDHIEDLLSQLQGIFGKLSRQDEEESRDKTEAAPQTVPPSPAAPPPVPMPDKKPSAAMPESPPVVRSPAEPPAPPPAAAPSPAASTPAVPAVPPETVPADSSHLATGIVFPGPREVEARALAAKLETITPKFTKVEFRLKVVWTQSYDPKTDWTEGVLSLVRSGQTRALFVILERPLDDAKRKVLIAELEKSNVYFQEVPLLSIEKKAFYTDVLLGLVFFIDSQKPPSEPAA